MVKTEKAGRTVFIVLDFTVPGSADCRLLTTTSMAKRRFRLVFSIGIFFFRYESRAAAQGQATAGAAR